MAKLSKADQAIFDAHPNAIPHDLLTLHGMSQAGYNKLINDMDDEMQVAAQAKAKVLTPSYESVLNPVLGGAPARSEFTQERKVRIKPVNSSVLGTEIRESKARAMMDKHPGKYIIVR